MMELMSIWKELGLQKFKNHLTLKVIRIMYLANKIPIRNKDLSQHPNFIHLRDNILGEYHFIYHINDGFSIDQLSDFSGKEQLFFQKMDSKTLQMNLMMVDSIFPLILADVVLEVFLNDVSSFYEYSQLKNKIAINDLKLESRYLEYKFKNFIHYLLFSDIASQSTFNGKIFLSNVYYSKNQKGELKYYSIYEQKELQELIYQELKLDIYFEKSFIKKGKANICLTIKY